MRLELMIDALRSTKLKELFAEEKSLYMEFAIFEINKHKMKKLFLVGLSLFLANGTIILDDGGIHGPINQIVPAVTNLVKNGDFEDFDLKGLEYRITKNISGWKVNKKGEVGYGRLYNQNWPEYTKVIELDARQNVKYISEIKVPSQGIYFLSFSYAARET